MAVVAMHTSTEGGQAGRTGSGPRGARAPARTQRGLRKRQDHAPPASERPALLCSLASATACLLTAQDDLTGATPSQDEAIRCARALGIEDEQREDLVDAAYAELGAVLDVL